MSNTVYSVGQIVTVQNTVTIAGVLTNATAMALTYRDPTGTNTTVTPSNPSVGVYTYDITIVYAGVYNLRWVGTGTAAGANQDSFAVQPVNV